MLASSASPSSTPLPLEQEQEKEQEQDRYLIAEEESVRAAEEPRICVITDGLRSKYTKISYRVAFNHFLDETIKHRDLRALLNTKQSVVESKIIDHVMYLKDVRQLAYRSILVHLDAIFHFFEINDYDALKSKRIKRFLPEDESEYYGRDRPYSTKEIEQILSKCDVRDRAAVLIMLSTGMRIGGLQGLQIGDIRKIDEFSLYLISVYNRSGKFRYYCYSSPECAVAIDEYLAYRARIGERLKDKSPLIRDKFNMDNYIKAPKSLSISTMSLLFKEALKRSGVNQVKPGQKKRDVMRSHGFRKFFINQCIKAGLTESTWKPLVGHKLPKTDSRLHKAY